MTPSPCTKTHPASRGIALVAVLWILTITALIACVFIVFITLERESSASNIHKAQADMLSQSAVQHALSLLRKDIIEQPAWDDPSESWCAYFTSSPGAKDSGCDVDGLPNELGGGTKPDARWIYVKGADGRTIGRYAVLVEDESGKININVAAALSPDMQNEGFGPFEILLSDGKGNGLPLSMPHAKNILKFRYGRDGQPGQSTHDDNLTASRYAVDEIDNDGDGLVDETDEGLDEPEEFIARSPRWDDRTYLSVSEICPPGPDGSLSDKREQIQILRRFASVNSSSSHTYWDDRDKSWSKQVNLNVATKKQLRKLLNRANAESAFEPSSKNLRALGSNIIDYRDENHVLSTIGSEYGVEAVCFNEVMANDGSYTVDTDWENPTTSITHGMPFPYRFGWWYHNLRFEHSPNSGWPITSVGGRGGGGSSLQNGERKNSPGSTTVKLSDDMRKPLAPSSAYQQFKKIRKDAGGWAPDMWKNGWLAIYNGISIDDSIRYPILGNTKDTLTVGFDDQAKNTYDRLKNVVGDTTVSNTAWIQNLWRRGNMVWCAFPEMSEYWAFPVKTIDEIDPPKDLYYYVYMSEQARPLPNPNNRGYWPSQKQITWKGYNRFLDVDGDPQKQTRTEMEVLRRRELKGSTLEMPEGEDQIDLMRFAYKNGEPVRAKNGFIHVLLSTTKDTGYVGGMNKTPHAQADASKHCFDSVQVMRPDVVELINISDQPISLRNWRVVINTGSYADQVGLIENAVSYCPQRKNRYEDPNPVIPPNGYFYLTNKRSIFDLDYGDTKDGVWGTSPQEAAPCFELPDQLWGVRYEITKIKEVPWTYYLKGANWRDNQMQYEMAELHTTRTPKDTNPVNGMRRSIYQNGRNWIRSMAGWMKGPKVGDSILLLGMPRQGGFLSMTLKNEYNQIAARTIEYGSTEPNELNYSTEKFDPTHYTWVKSATPTISGVPRQAKNHSLPSSGFVPIHIKDNSFASIGEIQLVRKAEDWENIGQERKGAASTRTLKAIGKYFTTSGIRLDPEESNVHVRGWERAFGTATASDVDTIVSKGCNWVPGIWKGQKLTVTSGKQKGEQFVIVGNTANSLTVDGYSSPSFKKLSVKKGDCFAVGPGYKTAFYYTRNSNEEGIWEWKNKNIDRTSYGVYLFGLNDSIRTTEFLEENFNASMECSVFNYTTRKFDVLPTGDKTYSSSAATDPYDSIEGDRRLQYEKSDGMFCGMISPDHISPDGGIKLRIIPHNLDDPNCSGFAWFDYAYLAPGYSEGRININTAPLRVLKALQKVSPDIAANIMEGRDKTGRPRLKPYKNITDILDVKGVSPAVFKGIANLITTRSDHYRIQVVAETLNDVNRDGNFNTDAGDKIMARTRTDVVVDRSQLTDDNPESSQFIVQALK